MKIIIRDTSKEKSTSIYRFEESDNKTIQSLFDDYKLDKNIIYLISNGKVLKEDEPLINYNDMIIETRVRLKGGKGGFGTNLKIQQAVKKQTKNFDACRDLQGRRLRKVNQERQLNEWRVKKAEEEKLLQTYIDGHNDEEDLFKKIINEKKQGDAIRKNKLYYNENKILEEKVNSSFKYYLKKKRERAREKEECEKQKYDDIKNGKKIIKLKKIKKLRLKIDNDEEKLNKEKEDIEKIKKMENEEDLFNAILA